MTDAARIAARNDSDGRCNCELTQVRASRLRLARALRECFASRPLSQAAWDAAAEAKRIVREEG